jgi:hypothetical protein
VGLRGNSKLIRLPYICANRVFCARRTESNEQVATTYGSFVIILHLELCAGPHIWELATHLQLHSEARGRRMQSSSTVKLGAILGRTSTEEPGADRQSAVGAPMLTNSACFSKMGCMGAREHGQGCGPVVKQRPTTLSSTDLRRRLHVLVGLIRRLRQRRLLGVGLIRRLKRRWLLAVGFIWRLRQRWPLGALCIGCCSWIGQRWFERFTCLGSRMVEHNMAPGKWIRGRRAATIRYVVERHNLRPSSLPYLLQMVRLAEAGAMVKIARF